MKALSPLQERYQLLGPLAGYGDGDNELARGTVPGGLSKLVVILRSSRPLPPGVSKLVGHPNLVQVVELGVDEEGPFTVLEYVRGRNLRDVLARAAERGRPLSPIPVARICAQALHGLHHAHRLSTGKGQGIVHGDVRPENILVGFDGVVRLLGFSGRAPRKPYQAPEQVAGRQTDHRADIFAIGVVANELLGDRSFSDLPIHLAQTISRAISPRPQDRFGTAGDMAFALEEFLAVSGAKLEVSELAMAMQGWFGTEPGFVRPTTAEAMEAETQKRRSIPIDETKRIDSAAVPLRRPRIGPGLTRLYPGLAVWLRAPWAKPVAAAVVLALVALTAVLVRGWGREPGITQAAAREVSPSGETMTLPQVPIEGSGRKKERRGAR
jgi:serine/threonine protein kinase